MDADPTLPMILRSAESGGGLRVNRTFTERLGLTSEELDKRPLCKWIHPDDREPLERALKAGSGTARARHQSHDGKWIRSIGVSKRTTIGR